MRAFPFEGRSNRIATHQAPHAQTVQPARRHIPLSKLRRRPPGCIRGRDHYNCGRVDDDTGLRHVLVRGILRIPGILGVYKAHLCSECHHPRSIPVCLSAPSRLALSRQRAGPPTGQQRRVRQVPHLVAFYDMPEGGSGCILWTTPQPQGETSILLFINNQQ